jgi:ABC-type transport system involved in multi-copper enzyme maturation permease subunit
MQARTLQIAKEGRLILWTWIAVILTAGLTAALKALLPSPGRPNDITVASAMGFWLGIPLLAHVVFGEEFHQRTISLLLSQPIDRMKVWKYKWLVLIAAVCSAGFVHWLVWGQQVSADVEWTASVWAVVTVCTAAFWTLEARSTIGGVALNVIQVAVFVTMANLFFWLSGISVLDAHKFDYVFALCYGALMFWLARRKFSRLEAVGDAGSADLLAGNATLTFLRCRRSGATLNLFRKELRFLSPVVIITIVAALFVLGLAMFRPANLSGFSQSDLNLALSLYSILPALLAGSVSMGEERNSGTHSWHLTLPVSTTRLWSIKVATALLVNAISVTVLAVVALIVLGRPSLSSSPSVVVDLGNLLLFSSSLTVAAFWCSCAMKGTIRAIVAVLPAYAAVFVGLRVSMLATMYLQTSSILAYALGMFHPYPWSNRISEHGVPLISAMNRNPLLPAFLLTAPVVFVALAQTLNLFRREVANSIRTFVRLLLLPVGFAALVAFIGALPITMLGISNYTTRSVLTEAYTAIQNMHIDPATVSETSPRVLTFEDLRQAAPMSSLARQWLSDATVSISNKSYAYPMFNANTRRAEFRYLPYALVHLKHQWDCYVFPGYGPFYSFCSAQSETWGFRPGRSRN